DLFFGMTSSENPPVTKRHRGRHKRDALRIAQKGKGRCVDDLGHIGRQASGEGGIRTPGDIAATPVFETGPIGRSGTSPNGLFSSVFRLFLTLRKTGLFSLYYCLYYRHSCPPGCIRRE